MTYKLIIFDFDGTLADTLPWALSIADQVADKYKLRRFDRRDLDYMRRQDVKTLLKQYKIPLWKLPLMARYIQRLLSENLHRVAVFEGVDAVLEQLSQAGLLLALVSSNSRRNVRRVLGPANMAHFRYVECGASVLGKHAKLKKVLRRAKVRPGEALVIGDELRDVDAARRARIPFGAVAWGYSHFDALQERGPRETFHSVGEIARLAPAHKP